MLIRFIYLVLFITLSGHTITSHAATTVKKIPSKKVYQVGTDSGKPVYCTGQGTKAKFVIKQSKIYTLGSEEIKVLSAKVSKAKGRTKASLSKKLKALKARVKSGQALCLGTSSGTPTPTPTQTPYPDPVVPPSLDKLARPLTRTDVQLLLDKAGFGLSTKEEHLVSIGTTQGIDALVEEFMKTHEESAGLLARVADRLDGQIGSSTTQSATGQRGALLDLWIHTNNPYAEKLSLILLSIWTTAGDVIEDETFRSAFWDYYERLRTYAHGDTSLPDLGVAITRDPLMLIYLNNELNTKQSPNENYARELMELFTLGPTNLDGGANYTETSLDGSGDIAVAAKLLTGWRVKKDYIINKLIPFYDGTRHANGPHTMFQGTSYAFSGENDEDLVRGIFAHHPGVKNYYAKEILKEYLTPDPPRSLIEGFGSVLEQTGYRLRPAMKVLLSSDAFYRNTYRDTVPVNSLEFAVKAVRLLNLFGGVNISEGERQLRQMGIQINTAPSVFWYNQDSWIGSAIALEKGNFIAQILNDTGSQAQATPAWTAASVLPQGSITNVALISTLSEKLGIRNLSEAQNSTIQSYLTRRRNYDGSYSAFTYNNSDISHQKLKGLGLYYLLFLHPSFQLN